MAIKLFDSELKVLELLWQQGPLPAKQLAQALGQEVGWSKTTTYTVIKKCVEKGAVAREEPGFLCRPLVTRPEIQAAETDALIHRMYGGAADQLVAALLGSRRLSAEELKRLRQMIDQLEEEQP